MRITKNSLEKLVEQMIKEESMNRSSDDVMSYLHDEVIPYFKSREPLQPFVAQIEGIIKLMSTGDYSTARRRLFTLAKVSPDALNSVYPAISYFRDLDDSISNKGGEKFMREGEEDLTLEGTSDILRDLEQIAGKYSDDPEAQDVIKQLHRFIGKDWTRSSDTGQEPMPAGKYDPDKVKTKKGKVPFPDALDVVDSLSAKYAKAGDNARVKLYNELGDALETGDLDHAKGVAQSLRKGNTTDQKIAKLVATLSHNK